MFLSLPLVVVELLVILQLKKIKVAKHIWDPCCPLAAETGS
jgi:hypothetical protein